MLREFLSLPKFKPQDLKPLALSKSLQLLQPTTIGLRTNRCQQNIRHGARLLHWYYGIGNDMPTQDRTSSSSSRRSSMNRLTSSMGGSTRDSSTMASSTVSSRTERSLGPPPSYSSSRLSRLSSSNFASGSTAQSSRRERELELAELSSSSSSRPSNLFSRRTSTSTSHRSGSRAFNTIGPSDSASQISSRRGSILSRSSTLRGDSRKQLLAPTRSGSMRGGSTYAGASGGPLVGPSGSGGMMSRASGFMSRRLSQAGATGGMSQPLTRGTFSRDPEPRSSGGGGNTFIKIVIH